MTPARLIIVIAALQYRGSVMRRVLLVGIVVVVIVVAVIAYYIIGHNLASKDPLDPLRNVLSGAPNALTLTSTSLSTESTIPKQFTCDGADKSPPLSWSRGPEGTVSYAVLMYDPDAPKGTFYHWVIYNIPPNVTSLPEGVPKTFKTSFGLQCINDFRRYGYGGPCPPHGSTHRYVFVVLALDTKLNLPSNADARAFLNAVKGHVLAYGALVVSYGH